jgi:GNAT superfamily N-acetyltransferase
MEPTFAPAASAEVDLLAGLMREYYACDGLDFDEGRARQGLGLLFADPGLGGAWLIRARGEDGEAVGYLVAAFGFSLEYGGRIAVLDELYLRESHRGRGWGRRALAFFEDLCRGRGILSVHLVVLRGNARARALYERAGFEAHDRDLLSKQLDSLR